MGYQTVVASRKELVTVSVTCIHCGYVSTFGVDLDKVQWLCNACRKGFEEDIQTALEHLRQFHKLVKAVEDRTGKEQIHFPGILLK